MGTISKYLIYKLPINWFAKFLNHQQYLRCIQLGETSVQIGLKAL